MSSLFRGICSSFIILLLCFTQYACQVFHDPPDLVVKEAIQLKIQLKHQSFQEFLNLEDETAEVLRMTINSRNYVPNKESNLLSVSGYIDCKFPGFTDEVTTPFLVFLQRGEMGESWSLVEPLSFSNELPVKWRTFPLPIKD